MAKRLAALRKEHEAPKPAHNTSELPHTPYTEKGKDFLMFIIQ
jgi:hypothetical protein